MSFLRSRYAIVLAIAVGAIIWAGLAGRDHAQATPGGGSARDPLPVELVDDDPSQLRSELMGIRRDWSTDGGALGFPFWEKAYREWRRGSMPGSTFKHYTESYRQMLERCEADLQGRSLRTDGAKRIRERLLYALSTRINALSMMEALVNRELGSSYAPKDEANTTREQERILAIDELQRSYRATRDAMNRAQRQLDLLRVERIPEDSFL